MDKSSYELVWADDFDYEGTPRADKWSFEVGNHQCKRRKTDYLLSASKRRGTGVYFCQNQHFQICLLAIWIF